MSTKKENVKFLKFARMILSKMGVLPENGKRINVKTFIKTIVCFLIFGTPIFVGMLGDIYQGFQLHEKDDVMNAVIRDFVFFDVLLMFSCSIVLYCFRKGDIPILFSSFDTNKYGRPKHFTSFVQKWEKISVLICLCNLIGSCSLILRYHLSDLECLTQKKSIDKRFVCNKLCPFWFPIEIAYIDEILLTCYVILFGFYSPTIIVVVCYIGISQIIALKIQHLIDLLKRLNFQEKNEKKIRKQFNFCIDYYNEISENTQQLNTTFGFFLSPTQNGLMMMYVGIQQYMAFVSNDPRIWFQIFFGLVIEYSFCRAGQNLEDVSEELSNTIYNLPWYDMDLPMKVKIQMFLLRSQKIFQLEISPYLIMNMNYFHKFMKGLFSFIMFLRNVKSQ
ncbi:hypothetical protein WA026_005231 [Henosepilachna vigintioctopunctata]|uniref:Odorant receptor n=1 Tax=Henosepilachna vigintioctopunctata TaxID=420089 RepID=A0AAW1UXI0_9CUCU